ncbi:MAG: hypothetical protein H6744_15080 [Deltaproteobacteria bacterium]|nr:hypothetical protein [Deltaproteobacteria bacterium]MCB9788004.1 hypothetical protein [Deltaproteobacteria bacterium]
MRRAWGPVAVAILACGAACGGDGGGASDASADVDGGGGPPVPVSAENLEGYWIADGDAVPQWRPIFLHFGPASVAVEEAPPGVPVVESSGLEAGNLLGPFLLEDDGRFTMQRRDGSGFASYAAGRVERLTADTLEIQFTDGRSDRETFRRVEGCGGPGLWFGPSASRVVDAAWGPDGVLHMLAVVAEGAGDLSGYYQWIPPGRCTPYAPPVSILGDSLDVADDGTIRILRVAGPSPSGPGAVTLAVVPRAPWNRTTLDPVITPLTGAQPTSVLRPATRAVALPGGRTLAMWADGDTLRAWTQQPDRSFDYSERPLLHGSKVSPQFLDVVPDGEGAFVVRGDHAARGLRFDGATWSEWTPATHPELGPATIFTHGPDGAAYAAWARKRAADTLVATVVVGRRRADGGWDTVEAGLGTPQAIRVVDDGGVHLVASLREDRGPMAWIHVDGALTPDTWREAYTLYDQDRPEFVTTHTADESVFPLARLGPAGEVLAGGRSVAWRRPALEGERRFTAFALPVSFEAGTDLTLVLPTMGLECREDCTLDLPPREVLPARVEAPDGSSRPLLAGNVYSVSAGVAGPSWGVVTQPPPVDGVEPGLAVRGSLQQVEVRALGPAGSASQLIGLDVAPDGRHWAVWRDDAGLATVARFDAALEPERSRALEGLSLSGDASVVGTRGVLRALDGGGAVIYVDAYPGLGRALVFLDASLAEVKARPLDPGGKVALTDDGAWEARPAIGGRLGLVHYTEGASSSPAQTDLLDTDQLLWLGDGVAALGTSPATAQPVVDRYSASGTRAWGLEVGGAESQTLFWAAHQGVLLLFLAHAGGVQLGSTTLNAAGGQQAGVVALDGGSGAVTRQRIGGVGYSEPPTALAADATGAALLWAQETLVRFEYLPWSEGGAAAPVTASFEADVPAGFCAQAGAHCSTSNGILVPLPQGGFAAGWTQRQPTVYEGARVESVGQRAVIGRFSPGP